MEDFKKELKELLRKYNAFIFVRQEENDSFLYLEINVDDDLHEIIDSGYRDLIITQNNL